MQPAHGRCFIRGRAPSVMHRYQAGPLLPPRCKPAVLQHSAARRRRHSCLFCLRVSLFAGHSAQTLLLNSCRTMVRFCVNLSRFLGSRLRCTSCSREMEGERRQGSRRAAPAAAAYCVLACAANPAAVAGRLVLGTPAARPKGTQGCYPHPLSPASASLGGPSYVNMPPYQRNASC